MKAIKLLMAVTAIGLIWTSSSLGGDEKTGSLFGEDWFLWDEDFGFGDDFNWRCFGALELSEDAVSVYYGPEDSSDASDNLLGDSDASVLDDSDGSSDGSSNVAPVDDWIIDEGFYSDYGGSEGEELGWGETDDHPGMPGPDENALWIVFPYSNNVRTTRLMIQKDRYAKELIIPGTSGTLTIHEVKPDGTELTYAPSWQVKAKRAYRTWFTADSAGEYTVWYEVHDKKFNVTNYSNEIKYEVFENLAVVVPNEAKCPTETATLRALVSGCDNPVYQWYRGITSADGSIIQGETSSVYVIRNVSPEVGGYYTCNVTCNGESDEDAGRLYVGHWVCEGASPCKCQFK